MKIWKIILFVLVLILIENTLIAQGCSQCKLMSEQGSELEESSFASNINYGILYLMIIPYLLILFLFRKRLFTFLKSLVKR